MAKMRRTFNLRRLICRAALCGLCMLGARSYAAEDGGIFEDATAKVHTAMSENSDITANLIVGSGFEVLDTQTDESGAVWYRIKTDFGAEGYVKSDELARVLTEMPQNGADGNNADNDAQTEQLGELNVLETINLRRQPSTDSEIIAKVGRDTRLPYFGEYVNESGEAWYLVSYENMTGYVTDGAVAIVQQGNPNENIQSNEAETPEEAEQPNEDGQPEDTNQTGEAVGTVTSENPEQNQTQDDSAQSAAQVIDTEEGINPVPLSKERVCRSNLDLFTAACIIGDILGVAILVSLIKEIHKLVRISKTGKKAKKQEKRNNAYR